MLLRVGVYFLKVWTISVSLLWMCVVQVWTKCVCVCAGLGTIHVLQCANHTVWKAKTDDLNELEVGLVRSVVDWNTEVPLAKRTRFLWQWHSVVPAHVSFSRTATWYSLWRREVIIHRLTERLGLGGTLKVIHFEFKPFLYWMMYF